MTAPAAAARLHPLQERGMVGQWLTKGCQFCCKQGVYHTENVDHSWHNVWMATSAALFQDRTQQLNRRSDFEMHLCYPGNPTEHFWQNSTVRTVVAMLKQQLLPHHLTTPLGPSTIYPPFPPQRRGRAVVRNRYIQSRCSVPHYVERDGQMPPPPI